MSISPTSLRVSSASPEPFGRRCRLVITPLRKRQKFSVSNAGAWKSSTRSSRIPPTTAHPFCKRLEPLLDYPHRFLVIEGTLQSSKGGGRLGQYHKNGMMDFLDALTARYGIQIIYSDSREEAEERVANLAVLHYAYHFAEQQGLGRCLTRG